MNFSQLEKCKGWRKWICRHTDTHTKPFSPPFAISQAERNPRVCVCLCVPAPTSIGDNSAYAPGPGNALCTCPRVRRSGQKGGDKSASCSPALGGRRDRTGPYFPGFEPPPPLNPRTASPPAGKQVHSFHSCPGFDPSIHLSRTFLPYSAPRQEQPSTSRRLITRGLEQP